MAASDSKYLTVLQQLKQKIRLAQQQALIAVNSQLLTMYWEIGAAIIRQQQEEGWGARIIDTLSHDLKSEFPQMKGLSVRNLKYMRAFAEAYPGFSALCNSQLHN